MECKIIFKNPNDETEYQTVTLDSSVTDYSSATIENIASSILNESNLNLRKTLASWIYAAGKEIKEYKIEELRKADYFLSNASIVTLDNLFQDEMEKYEIDPNTFPSNIQFLLADRFDIGATNFLGRIIHKDGEQIIVFNPNDAYQVKQVFRYLRVIQKLHNIEEGSELHQVLKQNYNIENFVNIILKKDNDFKKVLTADNTLENLYNAVEYYLQNKKDMPPKVIDNISIKNTLESIVQEITYGRAFEAKYSDLKANIFQQETSQNESFKRQISTENLLLLGESIVALLSKTDDKQLKQELTNAINNKKYKQVAQLIISSINDEDFKWEFKEIKKDQVYFSQPLPIKLKDTFEKEFPKSDAFGIYTKKLQFVESYKGYNIYKTGDKKYYVSKSLLTLDSEVNSKGSLETAKKYIETQIKINPLRNSYNLGLKQESINYDSIYLAKKYKQGDIIKSTVFTVNNKKIFFNKQTIENFPSEIKNFFYFSEVANNYNSYSLEGFYNYVKGKLNSKDITKIQEKIDTEEKALLFLYLLGEQLHHNKKDITKDDINKVYDIITSNELKITEQYYYVMNQNNGTQGFEGYKNLVYKDNKKTQESSYVYKTTLFPIQKDNINLTRKLQYEAGGVLAVKKQLEAIANILTNQFGIKVQIINNSDTEKIIKENKIKPQNANIHGFILNGEIYINYSQANPNDLLHEFGHLLLGIVKSQDPDTYFQFVQTLVENPLNERFLKLKQKLYNTSAYDAMEEILADRLGESLGGIAFNDTTSLNTAVLNKLAENIFNELNLNPSTTIYQFSKIVKKLLKQTNTSEEEEVENKSPEEIKQEQKLFFEDKTLLDTLKTQRSIEHYISDQIQQKNIEEECK